MGSRREGGQMATILLLAVAFSLWTATFLCFPAVAQDDKPWKVEGKLLGKPQDDNLESKKSHDVSGIACDFQTGFSVDMHACRR